MIELTDDFRLIGQEISVDQAEQLKLRGIALIKAGDGQITVDLAMLKHANSLTVALLTAWFRAARLQNISIVFMNISEELRNIIDFSGLADVLLTESNLPEPKV